MKYILLLAIILIQTYSVYAQEAPAHDHNAMSGPKNTDGTSHAGHKKSYTPAGLMLPHFHEHGGWMVEYMYMGMAMNSLMTGSNSNDPYAVLSGINSSNQVTLGSGHVHGATAGSVDPFPNYNPQVLNTSQYRYMSVPIAMIMEMHMVSLMKSVSENITLSLLLPYSVNSMEMLSSNLEKSTMGTKGIGDITALMDWRFVQKEYHTAFVRLGVGLPTGSIGEKRYMPMMDKVKVPYNMQLGSGSYSTNLGMGYFYDRTRFTMGMYMQGIFRNGENRSGYRFGNRYEASAWIGYAILKWFTPSLRVAYNLWENVQGADVEMNPYMDPQNDPARQGGRRADAFLGFMLQTPQENIRIGIEGGRPFYQHLNGPAMGTNGIFNFKVQAMF